MGELAEERLPFPQSLMLDASGTPKAGVLDLGHDHYVEPFGRYNDPTDATVGYHVLHRKGPNPHPAYEGSDWCMGGITLDVPAAEGLTGARWQVQSMEPLTVSPSLLCECGDHGFIRDGKWVPA